MAKDATRRGGRRPGSGRKPKALIEKINEGIEKPLKKSDGFETADLEGFDIPPIKDYLKEKQKNGKDLLAVEAYNELYAWLKRRGCEELVSIHVIEQYAMTYARYVQCQEALNEYGHLAKHPTTGAAIPSPYYRMGNDYLKQCTVLWEQISQVVRENCADGVAPKDDLMKQLLDKRRYIK